LRKLALERSPNRLPMSFVAKLPGESRRDPFRTIDLGAAGFVAGVRGTRQATVEFPSGLNSNLGPIGSIGVSQVAALIAIVMA
jgi:hypothetical protein